MMRVPNDTVGRAILQLILGLVLAGLVSAATAAEQPAVLEWTTRPVDSVAVYRADPLDPAALALDDRLRQEQGLPYRFALAERTDLDPRSSGTWEELEGRFLLWRQRIVAPGALSLNLGFDAFRLPPGAQLSIYPADLESSDDGRGVRVFTDRDNDAHGRLWTPVILADDIIVELLLPEWAADDYRLTLTSVNRGYRYFGEDLAEKSGACNIDVVCPEGDDWRDEIRSVGVYTVAGIWKCTGVMVNNTALDADPLFLTANHCNVTAGNASDMVVYWNFQRPVCGSPGFGNLNDFQSGATFLASSSGVPGENHSDFALVRLDDPPDEDHGVTFAGWDRRDTSPTSAVAIHHPSTDEKSISFENDPCIIDEYGPNPNRGGPGTHLRVEDWDLGTTEPGSSGSPLFDENHRIVGQLHGGWAACGNDDPDWYGRIHTSWEGGGSPDNRLREWLDPLATGAEFLDLLDPLLAEMEVSPGSPAAFAGFQGGLFTPTDFTYTLSNPGLVVVEFTVEAEETWLAISPASGQVPPGGEVSIVVSLRTSARSLPVGSYETEIVFTNTTSGEGDAVRPVTLEVEDPLGGGAPFALVGHGPNPFVDVITVTYSMPASGFVQARIMDLRGRVVKDYHTVAADAGSNDLEWFGRDDSGRRMPAGVYVLVMKSGGQELRVSLTLAG